MEGVKLMEQFLNDTFWPDTLARVRVRARALLTQRSRLITANKRR